MVISLSVALQRGLAGAYLHKVAVVNGRLGLTANRYSTALVENYDCVHAGGYGDVHGDVGIVDGHEGLRDNMTIHEATM